jgi:hypothetical protein
VIASKYTTTPAFNLIAHCPLLSRDPLRNLALNYHESLGGEWFAVLQLIKRTRIAAPKSQDSFVTGFISPVRPVPVNQNASLAILGILATNYTAPPNVLTWNSYKVMWSEFLIFVHRPLSYLFKPFREIRCYPECNR